ncbi:hypothetical protein JXJ21_02850 [candidate division KSB1 bacterium]|nr:hypothetical protein [candidate division KSB1 bacterium]
MLIGRIKWLLEWNWQAAEVSYRRALELNPNDVYAHSEFCRFLIFMGRFEESIARTKLTMQLNPIDITSIHILSLAYFFYGKYDLAIQNLQRALELNESDLWINIFLAWNYTWKNEPDLAFKFIETSTSLDKYDDPWVHASLAACQAKLGKPEEARKTLAKLDELSQNRYVDPFNFFVIHATLNNVEEAIYWFKKAYEIGSPQISSMYVAQNRWFAKIKSEPEFEDIMNKLNFPE